MAETRMFVQLGKRYKNGRIAKAENYELKEFFDLCMRKGSAGCEKKIIKAPTKWDRFWKTRTWKKWQVLLSELDRYNAIQETFTKGMTKLIEQDEYGRKQK